VKKKEKKELRIHGQESDVGA